LFEPDVASYGDNGSAWAPLEPNAGPEFLSVGFDTPVHSKGATIREVYGNGFVDRIDAIDLDGTEHLVWTGIDTSSDGQLADFTVHWASTSYLTQGLKIHVNAGHSPSWEEIDAVLLISDVLAAVPEPSSGLFFGAGAGLCALRALRRSGRRFPR
jgi:hypothetical protein